MVDRNVRVRLSLDPHNFISGLGKSAFAAKAFAKSLTDQDSGLRAFNRSLDASRESTSMLIRAGIALGPALVPTLAAATPAAFGLAAGMAAAAAGGAVAALALNGVGDALTALNDYQLEPTADNLAKVEQAMAQLSPAAQEFSLFLQDLRPELQGLQDIAAQGFLPGLQEGIDDLVTGMPVFGRLVDNTASALGRLASEGGQAFRDDPFWLEFTRFIADEAGPTLETYGRVFANFGKMAGGVIMAFDPLADDFNSSLLSMSQRLAEWGTNLGDSSGFQEFTNYIREVGPQVWTTLGDIANALIQLVEAAAPLGGPTLQILSLVANTIAAIADSPVGTVLIGVASGLSAIASIKTLGNIASVQAIMGLIRGGAAEGAAAGIGFGRAAAGVAALGLALTDFDDSLGVANTASLGLLGVLAKGKWGGIVGAAAGAALDASAANNEWSDSLSALEGGFSGFAEQESALKSLRTSTADFLALLKEDSAESLLPSLKDTFEGIFGKSDAEEAEEALQQAEEAARNMRDALSSINQAITGEAIPVDNLEQLDAAVTRLGPAFAHAGIDINSWLDQIGQGGDVARSAMNDFLAAQSSIERFLSRQDSMAGRSSAVKDAISGLDDEMLSTADSADTLAAALEGLFTPQLDLSEATDAWTQALRDLRGNLAGANKTLKGNSNAALQNRSAIRDLFTSLVDLMNAQARAGAGAGKIAKTMSNGREQILRFAKAAGLGRKETADFLRTIGLTPKLVRIVMQANFTDRERELMNVRETMRQLPKEVMTRMLVPGAIQSRADVVALARELELTPNQKKILLGLIDNATGGIKGVISLLGSVHDKTVTLTTIQKTIHYNEFITSHPSGGPLQNLYDARGSIHTPGGGRITSFANGTEDHRAMIGRPGDMRIWNEPEAGGEAYIPLDPSKRRRSLAIWAQTGHMLGVPGFAEGDVRGGKPLGDKQTREILAQLSDRFGRRSPIVDAIERWLQKIDKADFSQRALNHQLREVIRAQKNPLLRQFNIDPRQDLSETRSEFRELMSGLKETFGPDAAITKRMDRMGHRMLEAAKRQDRAARKHEKAVDKLEAIEDRRRDFQQSVRAAFTHDAFGGEDVESRFDSLTQIQADANDAEKALRQFRRLGRMGLDDPIIRQLAASGNTSLIQSLAGSSPKQIRQFEQAFRRRQRVLKELGLLTGRQVFGDELQAQRGDVRRTNRTLNRLNRTMNRFERHMENRIERGAYRGTRAGVKDRTRQQQRRRRAGAVR